MSSKFFKVFEIACFVLCVAAAALSISYLVMGNLAACVCFGVCVAIAGGLTAVFGIVADKVKKEEEEEEDE